MSLTVKAYLEKPGSAKPEIRRFGIDASISSSYEYLTTKIAQVFPSLAREKYTIFWKDAEDDCIAFSSDEELLEALGFVQDGVFKVYIRAEEKEEDENGGEVHPNVICDGCDGQVRGIRFKCIQCPDYDICSKCEKKGMHAEHTMIRITTPGGGWMGFCPPPHHFGPPPPGAPWGPHHGPFGGGRGSGRGRGHPGWRHFARQWWRQWNNGGQDGPSGEQQEQRQGAARSEERPQPQTEGAANNADGGEVPNPANDYLKTIGEQVAAMLDPLGIDVDVDIETHGGEQRRCGRGGMGARWGPWGGPGHRCGGRSGKRGEGKKARDAGKEEEKKAEEGSVKAEESNGKAEETPTKIDMEMQTNEETGEGINPDVQMKEETGKVSPAHSSDGDWMVLTHDKESDDVVKKEPAKEEVEPSAPAPFLQSGGSGQGSVSGGLYPEVPQPADSGRQMAPNIRESLDQMLSMGYTNENNWLTSLLEAKDGDIAKTMDIIHARK